MKNFSLVLTECIFLIVSISSIILPKCMFAISAFLMVYFCVV